MWIALGIVLAITLFFGFIAADEAINNYEWKIRTNERERWEKTTAIQLECGISRRIEVAKREWEAERKEKEPPSARQLELERKVGEIRNSDLDASVKEEQIEWLRNNS